MSAPAPTVTAADYARAERFLIWNRDREVDNLHLVHRWIDGDRLRYVRRGSDGRDEVVTIDPSTGARTVSGEPADIAAARSTPPTGIAPYENPSPDGRWAAFVRNHDVWVREIATGQELPLTTDGAEHHAYAASPGYDLSFVTAQRVPNPRPALVLWSPDSRHLFTHRLDEREVADGHLVQAVPDDGSHRPRLWTYRYALAGDEHLPMQEPVVLDLAGRRMVPVAADPVVCASSPLVVAQHAWWSADGTGVYYLDRDRYSTTVVLRRIEAATGGVREVVRESDDASVLVASGAVFDPPAVRTLANGDVIWYSQRSGWGHLYYVDGASGETRHAITSGEWLVRTVVRVDEEARTVFFLGAGREGGNPYLVRLYRVGLDGSDLRLLTPEDAHHELVTPTPVRISEDRDVVDPARHAFSPSGRYFVDTHSRPDLPPVHVLRTADGELVAELERADDSRLRAGGMTPVETFEVLAADGVTPIHGTIMRPSGFDPARSYPVIDANYPGPQRCRTDYSYAGAGFDKEGSRALAELGFVVVTIDGRGTPHRSKAFRDHAVGRLDLASDLADHIAGLRQLAERYPSLDLDRVGIFGASGGGFRAAQAILQHPEFFHVAVSSEGNHDQLAYIAPWAEVYVGPVGERDYAASSTPPLAANLAGKLLLMHGDMDDNVHVAETLKLVDALVKANKDFDLLILPNENHPSGFTSPYFLRRQWDYFVRHLLGAEPPAGYAITKSA